MEKKKENSSHQKKQSLGKVQFSPYQVFVVGILAFLQFTIILDFMILSPLGALLMPALQIDASQFGLVVSAYAFSAGLSGVVAAGFADRYDRKKLLLFFYIGFVLGTLFCGLAPNFPLLLCARIVTGIFGGVIGSIVGAITTDLFPLEARGRVMGFIQTAFSASQILGLPFGLYLAGKWGWHSPFLLIVVVSTLAGILIWKYLQPITLHLGRHPDQNPFHHLLTTIQNKHYLQAFAATSFLSLGGFMIMPFASAFSVHNLGISMADLPLVYMTTGLSSILIGPFVGRAADAFGKYNVFIFGSLISILMVLIYTQLESTTLPMFMLINAVMFLGISSRMIPAQALMSAVPAMNSRGSFMSISSSLQQISGGIGSAIAGMIVVTTGDGKVAHFEKVGYVVAVCSGITLLLMYQIHLRIREKKD